MSRYVSMNLPRVLQEAIDACRQDSVIWDGAAPGDPHKPIESPPASLAERLASDGELRRHYEACLAQDARFQQAIENVPVPDGLEGRLLDRLAIAQAASAVTAANSALHDRRRWLWGAGGVAAVASLALVVGLWPRRPVYDLEALYRDVRDFHAHLEPGPATLLSENRPDGFEPSADILGADGPHATWHKVKRFLGRSGVAYQLQSDEGTTATLYVVKLSLLPGAPDLSRLLPTQPPKRPSFTDGVTTAAWQQGQYAYALVIDGPERHYRQFVREPRSLALQWPVDLAGGPGV